MSRLGSLVQRDALVEDRVRLAAEHLDRVAEVDERLGEVAGVHALAAHVGLAAVGEVRDLERRIRIESGRRHPSEAIGAHVPPDDTGHRVTGHRATGGCHQEMVIVRRSGVSGSTTCGRQIEGVGRPGLRLDARRVGRLVVDDPVVAVGLDPNRWRHRPVVVQGDGLGVDEAVVPGAGGGSTSAPVGMPTCVAFVHRRGRELQRARACGTTGASRSRPGTARRSTRPRASGPPGAWSTRSSGVAMPPNGQSSARAAATGRVGHVVQVVPRPVEHQAVDGMGLFRRGRRRGG